MCVKPASADRMITSILEMEIDGEVVDLRGWADCCHPHRLHQLHGFANGLIMHDGMKVNCR